MKPHEESIETLHEFYQRERKCSNPLVMAGMLSRMAPITYSIQL
uniref:Uncharacterized protein n=1 Tax=Arundo donax TaxID=35708 RepID=A0A0A9GQF5_ARUDO